LREFLDSEGIEGEILFDAAGDVQRAFAAAQVPTHVLLDADGSSVARGPELNEEVEAAIERIMIVHTRRPGR
jgi:hypothetical protein